MKKTLLSLDWWLLAPVLLLITLGLVTLFSLNPIFFRGQLFYVVLSLAVFLFCANLDYMFLKSLITPIYILSLTLLIVVFIIGFESHGAVRWVDVFGISLQFSELCKPLLSLSLVGFLSLHEDRNMRSFLTAGLLLVPIMLLILLQPDLGNALIYGGVGVFVLLLYGYPYRWFIVVATPIVLSIPVLWERLHDYQRKRLLTFLNPSSDPTGASYNVIQAIIAVGSGGFLGRGLSSGTQSGLRFLPERQTDFIFASLSEALGFVGSFIVIVAFIFLIVRLYIIFKQTDELFGKLFVACAFFFLMIHFFVNIGMNVGIVPVVGVTLPFLSFGGSSMLTNFIFLGIVMSIERKNKRESVLEIR
jgi:rod shape determining protein RodA